MPGPPGVVVASTNPDPPESAAGEPAAACSWCAAVDGPATARPVQKSAETETETRAPNRMVRAYAAAVTPATHFGVGRGHVAATLRASRPQSVQVWSSGTRCR